MAKYLMVLMLFVTNLYSQKTDSTEFLKNTIFYGPRNVTGDISINTYKDNKIGVSGFNFRLGAVGLGLHFTQGVDEFKYKTNLSEKPDSSSFVRDHIQGVYVDLQYYYDIKIIYTSVFGVLGYGALSGSQIVYMGYVDNYPAAAVYTNGFVYGLGFQTLLWDSFVVGVKWDSINNISLQLGYGSWIYDK